MWISATAFGDARWRKSSRSNTGNDAQCVEVADVELEGSACRAVRSSKNPDGPALVFAPGPFQMFIDRLARD